MSDERVRDSLFAALDSDATDRVALMALADWFSEQGSLAGSACLRWLLDRNGRPGFNEHQKTFGKYFWERQEATPILNDPAAQLPDALWLALGDNDEPHPVGGFKSYQTAGAAYRALIAAWQRVSP